MATSTFVAAADTVDPVLLAVDTDGALFQRVSSLDLGVAAWRTIRDPLEMSIGPKTVVLFDCEHAPSPDRLQRCCRLWPTVLAAARPDTDQALDAIRSGAVGYVDTRMSDESLRRTLLGVLRGEAGYTRAVIGIWLTEQRRQRWGALRAVLTDRQSEIVHLIAMGSTDREIATRLGIRTATAQKHVANVLRRLHVRNRAEAVALLLRDGSLTSLSPSDMRRQ